MCGRYPEPYQYKDINKYFAAVAKYEEENDFTPRYNIALTQFAPIIREDESERILIFMRWGLVPSWAEDVSIGTRMINARAETILEKPAYRKVFLNRRCLVPAGWFYEWKKEGTTKQPYLIRRRDRAPIAFAGLWERWMDSGTQKPLETFTIITTAANELVAPIHERMPLILEPEDFETWLSPGEPSAELRAAPKPDLLEAVPVSTWVNSPSHDDARCMEPLTP
jgi:putative SOS response-associated peptidase YedK